MRLFQEHVSIENFDPPPSIYRDKVDLKQIPLLKQFRQSTKRLPTPDKDAIIQLSNSFEKRRLGKQQRLLADIAQRCREQEIGDLSVKLSTKCNILTFQENKDVLAYSTAFPKQQGGRSNVTPECADSPATEVSGDSSKLTFERSYKHFPMRRIIKHQNKFDLAKTTLPKIKATFTKVSEFHKTKQISPPRINGAIQFEHHNSPRPDPFAPLTLPHLPLSHNADDKFDSSFYTSRLNLGQRNNSHVMLAGNTFGGKTYQTSGHVKRYNTFNDNVSPIHQLLGAMGDTYPPNSDAVGPETGPRPTPAALKT